MAEAAISDGLTTDPVRRRYVAFVAVIVLHAALFWIVAAAIRPEMRTSSRGELNIIVFNPHMAPTGAPPPPLSWMFQMPEEALVPEPEIVISPEQGSGGAISAGVMGQRLAPTLDPAHTNERPELPGTLGSIIASLSLRMRVFVLPDGSVLDAVIQKSTGEAEFDKLAIDWVKDNWRYLPATVNGRPIEAWTTVIVRFAAIH